RGGGRQPLGRRVREGDDARGGAQVLWPTGAAGRAAGAEPLLEGTAPALDRLDRGPAHPHRHDLQAGTLSILADIRPDSWNVPLFIHVFGAMILVGGVMTAAAALALARGNVRQLRFGFWTLLCVGLPGLIIMRIGAALIWHKYQSTHSFL